MSLTRIVTILATVVGCTPVPADPPRTSAPPVAAVPSEPTPVTESTPTHTAEPTPPTEPELAPEHVPMIEHDPKSRTPTDEPEVKAVATEVAAAAKANDMDRLGRTMCTEFLGWTTDYAEAPEMLEFLGTRKDRRAALAKLVQGKCAFDGLNNWSCPPKPRAQRDYVWFAKEDGKWTLCRFGLAGPD